MMRLSLTATSAALVLGLAGGAQAGDLRVRIDGVTEAVGTVRVALFASEADWKADRPREGHFVAARAGALEVVFADLPPGRYGITSFHDRNANETLDTNLLGMPTEPFGFANDARGRLGPPAFDAMSVPVGDATVRVEVRLQ